MTGTRPRLPTASTTVPRSRAAASPSPVPRGAGLPVRRPPDAWPRRPLALPCSSPCSSRRLWALGCSREAQPGSHAAVVASSGQWRRLISSGGVTTDLRITRTSRSDPASNWRKSKPPRPRRVHRPLHHRLHRRQVRRLPELCHRFMCRTPRRRRYRRLPSRKLLKKSVRSTVVFQRRRRRHRHLLVPSTLRATMSGGASMAVHLRSAPL